MKIAVCDDEKIIREDIARKVELLYPETALFLFENAAKLLASEEIFDIIFLDIQMDGISGMDAAKTLRERGNNAVLIFVTALEEYVFQAFDV